MSYTFNGTFVVPTKIMQLFQLISRRKRQSKQLPIYLFYSVSVSSTFISDIATQSRFFTFKYTVLYFSLMFLFANIYINFSFPIAEFNMFNLLALPNLQSSIRLSLNTHFTFFVERFNLCHNPIPFIILLALIYTLLILILFQFPQSTANCSLILPAKHLPSDFSILLRRLDSDNQQENTPQPSYFFLLQATIL